MLTETEQRVLDNLLDGPGSAPDIVMSTKIAKEVVRSTLARLWLRGLVARREFNMLNDSGNILARSQLYMLPQHAKAWRGEMRTE